MLGNGTINQPYFPPESFSSGTLRARKLTEEYNRLSSLKWRFLWATLFNRKRYFDLQVSIAECKQSIKSLGGQT